MLYVNGVPLCTACDNPTQQPPERQKDPGRDRVSHAFTARFKDES